MSNLKMSWNDRFAVIDHFKPTDDQVCAAFGLTKDELDTARSMLSAGTFSPSKNLDMSKFQGVFSASAGVSVQPMSTSTQAVNTSPASTVTVPTTSTKQSTATTYAKPETSTKKAKVPQKRGRKGDKIITALQAVPTTRVPVEEFSKQYNVSLAVLRQSKRFLEQLTAEQRAAIGKINVRQDKESHTLMIWREPNQQ